MKKNFLFYLLFITTISFAQEQIISGIIKDANTKLPIDRVSVSIIGSNMGTVSNEEGEFRINVPEGYSKLNFNHLNYSTKEYDFKINSEIEILLVPKEYLLEEVVINKNKDKREAENLLREAIVSTKKKTIKSNLMHTYYREINKMDGQYTSFSEGILDFYNYFKNEKWNRNRIKSDLFIKQSRVVDLRISSQIDALPGSTSVQDAVKDGYNLDWLEFRILRNRKKYTLEVETKTDDQANSIDIIYINPKKGLKEHLYIGTITIDSKTKLILDIDLKLSPELKQYSEIMNLIVAKVKINDWAMKSSFRIDGDKYILTYCVIKHNMYMKVGKTLNNTFESVRDLTVLDYNEGEFDYNKTQKYQKISLFSNGNNYTDEFWKKQNVRLLSDTEENMVNTLSQKRVPTLGQRTIE